jgi:hypothetical protein
MSKTMRAMVGAMMVALVGCVQGAGDGPSRVEDVRAMRAAGQAPVVVPITAFKEEAAAGPGDSFCLDSEDCGPYGSCWCFDEACWWGICEEDFDDTWCRLTPAERDSLASVHAE